MKMLEATQVQKAIYESGVNIGQYKVMLAHEVQSIRSPSIGVLSGLVTHVATIVVPPTPKHTGHHSAYMMSTEDGLVLLALVQ